MHKDLLSLILCCRSLHTLDDRVMSSIRSQTYPYYEIIIEDHKGNNNVMRNDGFVRSKGKYVFFCDEDIILNRDCLRIFYEKIVVRPDIAFVYCDYERTGELEGSHLARDFNVDILHKTNYISTMSLIRRECFPGFDPNIKRLQDYDLFLTIVDRGGIGLHIAKILFTAMYFSGGISTKGQDDWRKWQNIVRKKHNLH